MSYYGTIPQFHDAPEMPGEIMQIEFVTFGNYANVQAITAFDQFGIIIIDNFIVGFSREDGEISLGHFK